MSSIDQLLTGPAGLIAGIDHLSLDKRTFDPSPDDIKAICRFFAIGKLEHFEKEKGVLVSHSNFFVLAETTQGRYALKFYPPDTARTITVEYAVNRLLTSRHFPTPVMHAGRKGQLSFASNGRLVACFDYLDGVPAWQKIKETNTFCRINSALLSLKDILSAVSQHIPLQKQADLLSNARALARDSRNLSFYDKKRTMDASLRDVCEIYKHHRSLFTRQKLHNNASLTNFIICKKTIHTLDLSHIREDYILSDLASLIISCLFFNIPLTKIKAVAKDHFTRHGIGTDHAPVLNTLIKIGLIGEYLKNIKRERSLGPSDHPTGIARAYTIQLSKRKKAIAAFLIKINDNPRLIV